MKVAEKFGRKRQLPEKTFKKTSKKYLTNGKRCGTINKLSRDSGCQPRATQTKE